MAVTNSDALRLSPQVSWPATKRVESIRLLFESHAADTGLRKMIDALVSPDLTLWEAAALRFQLGYLLLSLRMDHQASEQLQDCLNTGTVDGYLRAEAASLACLAATRCGETTTFETTLDELRAAVSAPDGQLLAGRVDLAVAHQLALAGASWDEIHTQVNKAEHQAVSAGDQVAVGIAHRILARLHFDSDPTLLCDHVDHGLRSSLSVDHQDAEKLARHFSGTGDQALALKYYKFARELRQERPIPRLVAEAVGLARSAETVLRLNAESARKATFARQIKETQAERLNTLANEVRGLLTNISLASESFYRAQPESPGRAPIPQLALIDALTRRVEAAVHQLSRHGSSGAPRPVAAEVDLCERIHAMLDHQAVLFERLPVFTLDGVNPVDCRVLFDRRELDVVLLTALATAWDMPGGASSLSIVLSASRRDLIIRFETTRLGRSHGSLVRRDEMARFEKCELSMSMFGGAADLLRDSARQTLTLSFVAAPCLTGVAR